MSVTAETQSVTATDSPGMTRKDSYAYLYEPTPVLSVTGDLKVLRMIDLASNGMCSKFSSCGKMFAVGLANGDIKIFQTSTFKCVYHLSDESTTKERLPVTSLSYIDSDKSNGRGELLVATYASGHVKLWHITSAQAIHTFKEDRQVMTASINSSTTRIVTAGDSETVNIYDIETGTKTKSCEPSPNTLVMDGHRQRVFTAKYHPNREGEFITGGWDNTVQFWNEKCERSTRHLFGPHICGEGLDIDPKYNHILSASWRKSDTLQVWEYDTGRDLKNIPDEFDHSSMLYCCQWLGRHHIICGGSDGNLLRIIEKSTLETSGMMSGLPGGVYSIDYDRTKVGRAQHSSLTSDVTTIIATVGMKVYVLSNAPTEKSKSG